MWHRTSYFSYRELFLNFRGAKYLRGTKIESAMEQFKSRVQVGEFIILQLVPFQVDSISTYYENRMSLSQLIRFIIQVGYVWINKYIKLVKRTLVKRNFLPVGLLRFLKENCTAASSKWFIPVCGERHRYQNETVKWNFKNRILSEWFGGIKSDYSW